MTKLAAPLASQIVGALASGRLDLAGASALLIRRADENELPLDTLTQALREEASSHGLDPSAVEELIAVISGDPAARDAPATALRAPDGATRVRPGAASTAARGPVDARRAPEAQEEFDVGSLIKGRFKLESLVGRGGMGMVFRALDLRKVEARDPKPEVALKILNQRFAQHPDAFVALQREASKAQTLAHPNIVTVFDFDRDGASVFITMELLLGKSLEEVVRATRGRGIDRRAALPVIRGMAEGLAYAHRKGIVHSDLKPANVFLTQDRTPKILDFGIARAVPSAGDSGPKDEFDAGSLGAYTEGYATEEMMDGRDPAPADDMYAFGIIVYELLTGNHPFAGKSATDARASNMPPPPIRTLSRREWQTLARTLAFERSRRPRDAGEFLRLFFGATRLRNALITAVGVLATVSAGLWYRNYQQTGPSVPFEELPPATQSQVKADFAEGEKAWAFYQQGISNALTDSLSYYAEAYRLHKGNREAVKGLRRAANEMLGKVRGDPAALHETARSLAESSEYLKTYGPVVDAE